MSLRWGSGTCRVIVFIFLSLHVDEFLYDSFTMIFLLAFASAYFAFRIIAPFATDPFPRFRFIFLLHLLKYRHLITLRKKRLFSCHFDSEQEKEHATEHVGEGHADLKQIFVRERHIPESSSSP